MLIVQVIASWKSCFRTFAETDWLIWWRCVICCMIGLIDQGKDTTWILFWFFALDNIFVCLTVSVSVTLQNILFLWDRCSDDPDRYRSLVKFFCLTWTLCQLIGTNVKFNRLSLTDGSGCRSIEYKQNKLSSLQFLALSKGVERDSPSIVFIPSRSLKTIHKRGYLDIEHGSPGSRSYKVLFTHNFYSRTICLLRRIEKL